MALLIIRKKAKLPEPDALVPDAPKAQAPEQSAVRTPVERPATHRYLDGLWRCSQGTRTPSCRGG